MRKIAPRPSMDAASARELELMVFGYSRAWTGLRALRRDDYLDSGFSEWQHHEHGWSTSQAWGAAIDQRYGEQRSTAGLSAALELLNAYVTILCDHERGGNHA